MTETEYLETLRRELELRRAAGLTEIDFNRIVDDVTEKFENGLAQGKALHSIIDALGPPDELAEAELAARLVRQLPQTPVREKSRVVGRTLKALFVVAPVNFIVALGPLLVAVALVVALGLTCFALTTASLLSIVHFAQSAGGLSGGAQLAIVTFFTAAFFASLALAAVVTVFGRGVARVIWWWMRWNVDFLMKEPEA